MKALLYDKYSSVEGLEIGEIEWPSPKKKNEILIRVHIRVHAVSINDWDLGLIHVQGLLGPKRIVGSDIAGRVAEVGVEV